MNKKLLIPIFVIAFAVLATPVLATETYHYQGKTAYAEGESAHWGYYMFVSIYENNGKTQMYFGLYDEWFDYWVFLEYFDLKPSEFKWSYGACRLDTMVYGIPLTVQWQTTQPTDTSHTHEKYDHDVHTILNGAGRDATAFATFADLTFENCWYAFVGKYADIYIYK